MDATMARAVRYARAGARWSRLLTRGRPDPGVRVFYGHDEVPAPGEPVAGVRRSSSGWRLASPTTRPTSRSSTSARPGCRATFARSSGTCGVARSRSCSTRTASAIRAGRGATRRRSTGRSGRVLGAAEHVLYQSAFCKRAADELVGRARRLVGDPAQRGRDSALHSGGAASGGRPVLLLGGDQYQAYRLELGLETLAALLPSAPTRSSSSRGAL